MNAGDVVTFIRKSHHDPGYFSGFGVVLDSYETEDGLLLYEIQWPATNKWPAERAWHNDYELRLVSEME